MAKFQLATHREHMTMEPEFSRWWARFRIAHSLNTVPYHLELATRIASLESWIAARRQGSVPTAKGK